MRKGGCIRKCLKAAVAALVIFVMAAGTVCTAKAAVQFPDVADSNLYYYDAVYWAAENTITVGRGGYFKPDKACSRAEAVTFLYRLAGRPEVSGTSPFADITDTNSWYYEPVLWAAKAGITTGYGEKNGEAIFSPEVTCNRAMIVTLLMRYAEEIGNNYREPAGTNSPFPDVKAGTWYTKAVCWAAENGITTGKGDGKFYPMEKCTRAHMVTFLYRYVHMAAPIPGSGSDIELPAIPVN